jgi:hypothetical protein
MAQNNATRYWIRKMEVETESPSRLYLSRIEGLEKSPLTYADHRYGWSQAYGDLGLTSPCLILCRMGDVGQPCQYWKNN